MPEPSTDTGEVSDETGTGEGGTDETTGTETADAGTETASESDTTETETASESESDTTEGETNETGDVCGDGIVDEGEDCDDQNDDNTDDCLDTCEDASCGDGFVWAGHEECDDGDQSPGDGCDEVCSDEQKLVFVTSGLYNGNLGGLPGADELCTLHAEAAELSGTYLAWLSDSESSPNDRFAKAGVSYVRTDGVVVADGWLDLIDGTLDNPIDKTESGDEALERRPV